MGPRMRREHKIQAQWMHAREQQMEMMARFLPSIVVYTSCTVNINDINYSE